MNTKIKSFIPEGEVNIPSSKSDIHRAFIMAFLSCKNCVIKNITFSQDVLMTLNALETLGATIVRNHDSVHFYPPIKETDNLIINVGASGSTLRFLIPLATAICKNVKFIGEKSLFSRPLSVYEDIMKRQKIDYIKGEDYLEINGQFKVEDFEIIGNISSQFISGLLFFLCYKKSNNKITILEPYQSKEYIDITKAVMKKFGVNIKEKNNIYKIEKIDYHEVIYHAEKDFSQMAFFAVLGSLKGRITIPNMNPNSLQGDKKIVEILNNAGANITYNDGSFIFKEKRMKAIDIDLASCIDLGPIIFVLASFLEGTTRIYHTKRLKYKESDRVDSMKKELEKAGVDIQCFDDEVIIKGKSEYVSNCIFECHNDHRIAMALSVFSVVNKGECLLKQTECVNKSYPNFFNDLLSLKGDA